MYTHALSIYIYIYILVYGNASADRAEGSDPSADKFAGSATRHTARHRPKPCTHGFGKCRLSMGGPRPYSRMPSWREGQRTRRTTAYTLPGSRLKDCSEKKLDHILPTKLPCLVTRQLHFSHCAVVTCLRTALEKPNFHPHSVRH